MADRDWTALLIAGAVLYAMYFVGGLIVGAAGAQHISAALRSVGILL